MKVFFQGELINVAVWVRPHVKEFLEQMSEIYEIIYFTASIPEYAN